MDWKDLQQITWQGYARQNGGKVIRTGYWYSTP